MQITITATTFGSPDGIHVQRFFVGETHDVDTWPMSRELARSFVQAKVAELVKHTTGPSENKDDTGMVAEKQRKESKDLESEASEAAPSSPVETAHTKKKHA